MYESTWTFARADKDEERWLTIVRDTRVASPAVRLLLTVDGATRLVDFVDFVAAGGFQFAMEVFLLRTGWAFVAFAPERRSGRERRTLPRIYDRRRWWTDGTTNLDRFLPRKVRDHSRP